MRGVQSRTLYFILFFIFFFQKNPNPFNPLFFLRFFFSSFSVKVEKQQNSCFLQNLFMMHIPSGCSKLETGLIVDKVKGLIFGK